MEKLIRKSIKFELIIPDKIVQLIKASLDNKNVAKKLDFKKNPW